MLLKEKDVKTLWEEYKRFLVLFWANRDINPPKPVQYLWWQHIAMSALYRDFWSAVFDEYLIPKPYDTTTHMVRIQIKDYKHGIAFYEAAFGAKPNSEIWDIETKGKKRDFEFRTVNYLRAACYISTEICHFDEGQAHFRDTRRRNVAYYQKMTGEEAVKIVNKITALKNKR